MVGGPDRGQAQRRWENPILSLWDCMKNVSCKINSRIKYSDDKKSHSSARNRFQMSRRSIHERTTSDEFLKFDPLGRSRQDQYLTFIPFPSFRDRKTKHNVLLISSKIYQNFVCLTKLSFRCLDYLIYPHKLRFQLSSLILITIPGGYFKTERSPNSFWSSVVLWSRVRYD